MPEYIDKDDVMRTATGLRRPQAYRLMIHRALKRHHAMITHVCSLPGWDTSITGPLLARSIRCHAVIFQKILGALKDTADEADQPTNADVLDLAKAMQTSAQAKEAKIAQEDPGALPADANLMPALSPLSLTAATILEVVLREVKEPSEALGKSVEHLRRVIPCPHKHDQDGTPRTIALCAGQSTDLHARVAESKPIWPMSFLSHWALDLRNLRLEDVGGAEVSKVHKQYHDLVDRLVKDEKAAGTEISREIAAARLAADPAVLVTRAPSRGYGSRAREAKLADFFWQTDGHARRARSHEAAIRELDEMKTKLLAEKKAAAEQAQESERHHGAAQAVTALSIEEMRAKLLADQTAAAERAKEDKRRHGAAQAAVTLTIEEMRAKLLMAKNVATETAGHCPTPAKATPAKASSRD
ncbi:MAG: hypothetical protein M1826_007500 [Phylliscum demangeonii]|nr:MAG: hypothetical protein M1826_007500 [Phylliscum demangeonii]